MKIDIKWNEEGITRIIKEQKAHTHNIIGKDNNLLGINFQFHNFFLNAFIFVLNTKECWRNAWKAWRCNLSTRCG